MVRRSKTLGISFGDMISAFDRVEFVAPGSKGLEELSFDQNHITTQQETIARRLSPVQSVSLLLLIIGAMAFLASRLFALQIVEGNYNRLLSDENRLKTIIVNAPRGLIVDRGGEIIARNGPAFYLIIPGGNGSDASRRQMFYLDPQDNAYPSVLLLGEATSAAATKQTTFADGNVVIDTLRQYEHGELVGHLVGYVGEIADSALSNQSTNGCVDLAVSPALSLKDSKVGCDYRLGDRIGKDGLEIVYEGVLRGVSGKTLVEVDAQGRPLKELATIDPKAGHNITLSVDLKMQKVVFDALSQAVTDSKSTAGAAVVQNPGTGEILALVSYPAFDPNVFVNPAQENHRQQLLSDESKPLLNRVIGGSYPPGSTFKIISAAAGLSTGKITSQTTVEDSGVLYLGEFSFANWFFTQYGKTEGVLNVVRAIARSNDIFFYKVGEWVGLDDLAAMAKKFGLGGSLGIDLPGEIDGLVPSHEWKEQTFGQVWYPGDTLHMAIGQGFLLATPLQIMSATSVIANGGTLYRPFLVWQIKDQQGRIMAQTKPQPVANGVVEGEQLRLIREGMKQACQPGGTGGLLFNFQVKNDTLVVDDKNFFPAQNAASDEGWTRIPVACKTGTAEYGDAKKTHAWFTAYAPLDKPQLTVTVLVEGGGEGSSVAAPVAKKIFEYWFSQN